MRNYVAPAPALDPLSLKAGRSSRGADAFREGDEVVLTAGIYQGTLGIFLRLRSDVNWADITERNGNVESHPVPWLAHSNSATPGFSKVPEERV
jgi:hypothetical protein